MDGSADKADIKRHLAGTAEKKKQTDLKNNLYSLQIFLWSRSKPITKISEQAVQNEVWGFFLLPSVLLTLSSYSHLSAADTSDTFWMCVQCQMCEYSTFTEEEPFMFETV